MELVFFDTTSLYFEGQGGETLGQRGHTKDHRPDLPQMVVGLAIDVQGNPICCELWPGNTADVKTLVPVMERMRQRFGLRQLTVVADRGMVSQATLEAFEAGKPPVGSYEADVVKPPMRFSPNSRGGRWFFAFGRWTRGTSAQLAQRKIW